METVVLTPFLQDVIATAFALVAFAVLVYRTARIFRSSDESPACDGCSNACTTTPASSRDTDVVMPLVVFRRPPGA